MSTDDFDLSAACDLLAEWARATPLVKRAWVFGSRARSEHRPDSDLDIALELDPAEFIGSDDSGGWVIWTEEADAWEKQLGAIFGPSIDLDQFIDEARSPNIARFLQRSSHLAYEKNA